MSALTYRYRNKKRNMLRSIKTILLTCIHPGIQQSPAAGQCLAEMICGVEPHLDITALGLQRVLDNKPYTERNII